MHRDHVRRRIDVAPYALRADRPEDENLHELAENLRTGYGDALVVLLGAGASVGATASGDKLPTAVDLRDELWRRFMLPAGSDFDFSNLGAMTLDQAAAFAETKVGRAPVKEFMAARFRTERTLWQHAVLRYLRPKSLFTTNYDLLVEQVWNLQMPNNGVCKYWAERLRIRAIDRRFAEFMADLDDLMNFIPPECKYEQISERQKQQLIQ